MLNSTAGKTITLLLTFVVLSVGAILLDNRGLLDLVKRPVESVFSPITSSFTRVAQGTGSDADSDLAAMTAERDYYRSESIRLQNAESENAQLRDQLGIEQKYGDFDVLSAGVLARDPSNSQKFVTIDKGEDDGLTVGMAVVDPNNYVGQITEVGPTQSRVTLMIDTQANPLSVEIVTGGDGMMYGMWQAGGRAEIRYVDIDAKPQPGDAILTSSDGATQSRGVPGGLLIGTVGGETRSDPLSDDLTVPIIPNADFDNLEVVTVILGSRPGSNVTNVTPSGQPSASAAASAAGSGAPSGSDNPGASAPPSDHGDTPSNDSGSGENGASLDAPDASSFGVLTSPAGQTRNAAHRPARPQEGPA